MVFKTSPRFFRRFYMHLLREYNIHKWLIFFGLFWHEFYILRRWLSRRILKNKSEDVLFISRTLDASAIVSTLRWCPRNSCLHSVNSAGSNGTEIREMRTVEFWNMNLSKFWYQPILCCAILTGSCCRVILSDTVI